MAQPVSLKTSNAFDVERYREAMACHLDLGDPGSQLFFQALDYAQELHRGQVRKSGAPYISHPCAVAEILVKEMGILDPEMLAAAVLHDVIEDVPEVSFQSLERRFGSVVAELVDGCTKMTRSRKDRAALKDLTHSKILQTASRRLGVLVIKLADRLHNLRTLHYLSQPKRQRIAQETVEIYAPLAAKLNIFSLKRELYHLALSYLYPRKSKKILNTLKLLDTDEHVLEMEQRLRRAFEEAGLPVQIRRRVKGLGTYYDSGKKTLRLTNTENRVDFTIVVDTEDVRQCYFALGVVDTLFRPVPRTIRDFIANPKNNGYMSLHTRVHFRGENYLIKIRTQAMDQWARQGLLSQWRRSAQIDEAYLEEISDFLRTIGEYGGGGAQRRHLIQLSEAEEVTVYTPLGDAHVFPQGSIVLDFAYKIHSDLGNHCKGALVNGRFVRPTHVLSDGETVEILKAAERLDLDPDLESLCRTPKARSAINREVNRRRRDYAQWVGQEILRQELEHHGFPRNLITSEITRLILDVLNLKSVQDLFVQVGQDLVSPHLVLYYLLDATPRPVTQAKLKAQFDQDHPRNVLRVPALDPVIHKFAGCCHPFPGERGVVATLSERGITFHRGNCRDLSERHDLPSQRLMDVRWVKGATWTRPIYARLRIQTKDKAPLLHVIGSVPGDIEVCHVHGHFDRSGQWAVLDVVLRGFDDARRFFGAFPPASAALERYSFSALPDCC
ncbi:GTP pyrophosphokinase [Desulfacinum hydrothermale DSM 13146]|uniref:GTP pyrophosphokinase n=1 Tax=Desulfacinum hydrothermale DSM 13146 TaxID=1121390 RepID=A0A1W1XSJ9_9BACT|nr:HD domain-containing protein [Desulfacinum hydrothermale]SMC26939.1 GTP pyrophosphokinase [Desulfacinum hydrothermale DSM 13146]